MVCCQATHQLWYAYKNNHLLKYIDSKRFLPKLWNLFPQNANWGGGVTFHHTINRQAINSWNSYCVNRVYVDLIVLYVERFSIVKIFWLTNWMFMTVRPLLTKQCVHFHEISLSCRFICHSDILLYVANYVKSSKIENCMF